MASKPDTRPSWKDPSMPVLRKYKMPDGSMKTEVDPEYEQRYRAHMIESASPKDFPSFRQDPTYNLRKTRK